jgi:hypothetical protein
MHESLRFIRNPRAKPNNSNSLGVEAIYMSVTEHLRMHLMYSL